jgi:UDP-galactopyranose mutase
MPYDPIVPNGRPDLVCFSHLKWDLVFQRPQHLLTRFAAEGRVFYVEEPNWGDGPARLEVDRREGGLHVVRPHLKWWDGKEDVDAVMRGMVDRLFRDHGIGECVLWYYTPMALAYSRHVRALATVYDCMDELSAFRDAPPAMLERERELLRRADLVFTGGASLFEAKRGLHTGVHLFPSSIDAPHFRQARAAAAEPADQAGIARPRIGFYGVIDERMDLELLRDAAAARPEWQWVILGPVVKIEEDELPRLPNIHYPGARGYADLPRWLAGWDVAVLPFARNESTRFISPTKTPEYLAAGRPVVSTPIPDVVRPYGDAGVVAIEGTAEGFVSAVEAALARGGGERAEWLRAVDEMLAGMSWDRTWSGMAELLDGVVERRGDRPRSVERAATLD